METSVTGVRPVREELLGPGRREVTVGIVLLISLTAFEAMGVGTAMPALVADLGSVSSYAWPFVSFVAATVVGTVLGGRWCDVRGPGRPLVLGPTTFGLGLLAAGTAGTMTQLLAGRVLQGLGAGAGGVAVYVLIAAVYPPRARPAVFGLISSAWVVPSLVGPPVSGFVTERWSWHQVFLGLLPLVVLAVALVLPAVRRLEAAANEDRATEDRVTEDRANEDPAAEDRAPARRAPVVAALGAALGVAALSWAGEHASALGVGVAVVGLAVLAPSVVRLVPEGTARARRGVPAVVAARALAAGSFFTVNAYLPLILVSRHGWSLAAAGTPLIVASLGWSASAAWQARHADLDRQRLVRAGFLAIAVGALGLVAVVPEAGPAWLALPVWGLAGVGMGLAFSSISYLLLQESASTEVGYHSSAAQLADQIAQALFIGAGGTLLALLASPGVAMVAVLGVVVVLALAGAGVGGRTSSRGAPSAQDALTGTSR